MFLECTHLKYKRQFLTPHKVYSSEDKLSFIGWEPGKHVICLQSNRTKSWANGDGDLLRVYLDIQVGVSEPMDFAGHRNPTELELRLGQLLAQVEQITKEQNHMRWRSDRFKETSWQINHNLLWWALAHILILLILGALQMLLLKQDQIPVDLAMVSMMTNNVIEKMKIMKMTMIIKITSVIEKMQRIKMTMMTDEGLMKIMTYVIILIITMITLLLMSMISDFVIFVPTWIVLIMMMFMMRRTTRRNKKTKKLTKQQNYSSRLINQTTQLVQIARHIQIQYFGSKYLVAQSGQIKIVKSKQTYQTARLQIFLLFSRLLKHDNLLNKISICCQ